MKQRVLALILALLPPLAGCNSRHQSSAFSTSETTRPTVSTESRTTASSFDFYMLNLSWSPEFCHSHPAAQECATHSTFVLHGLWPENKDGTYPESCSNTPGPADPSAYKDIYPDPGLLEHEWHTHGTCSGLSADNFFITARSAYRSVSIPPEFGNLTVQISMPPDQILGLFTAANPAIPRSSLALSCGSNYLSAVEICIDKSLHPITCSGIRTCRASTVRIPPP